MAKFLRALTVFQVCMCGGGVWRRGVCGCVQCHVECNHHMQLVNALAARQSMQRKLEAQAKCLKLISCSCQSKRENK